MTDLYEKAAENFLELASHQRLQILFQLLEKKSTITEMAKSLDTTKQEVHRNFTRLEKSKLIVKEIDGKYTLTTFGRTMCTQVPSIVFLSQNMKYFEDHTFGDIPLKFVMRAGQLASGQHVKGVAKVLEQWKNIYKNANEFIYELLSEVPLDLIEPLVKKVKNGVKFQYIFSQSAIVPKGRRSFSQNLAFLN